MTEDEKAAAEATAEVFVETFMRLLRERLTLNVTALPGAMSPDGESSIMISVSLVDYGDPAHPKMITTSGTAIRLRYDPSHRPYLAGF